MRYAIAMVMLINLFAVPWVQAEEQTPTSTPSTVTTAMPPKEAASAEANEENLGFDDLITTVMAARLSKQLNLNDEQTVLMLRRLDKYRTEMAEMKKQRQVLLKELRVTLESKSDERIQEKLNQLLQWDEKMGEMRRKAHESTGEGLSVAQRAKLYVFFSDFENDLRRLIQRARQRASDRFGEEGLGLQSPKGMRGVGVLGGKKGLQPPVATGQHPEPEPQKRNGSK